jgi:mannosyltransferase OCH1-like enzyme
VQQLNKPDVIYLYYDHDHDNNIFWSLIKKHVTLVRTAAPTEFRGIPLDSYQYKADVIRLEKLIEFGGVYVDLDVLSLRPFTKFFEHNLVLGVESSDDPNTVELDKINSITNAVLLAEPQNPFLMSWYEKLAENMTEDKPWAYHAVCLPKEILENEEHNYHLEPKTTFMPFCFRDAYIFDEDQRDKQKELAYSTTIHLWETIWYDDYLYDIDVSYFDENCNIFSKLFRPYLGILCSNKEQIKEIVTISERDEDWYAFMIHFKMWHDICRRFGLETEIKLIEK